jgi:hypothetical protein
LGTEEILVGTILALALGLTASFLQSRRSQSDFVLWDKGSSLEATTNDSNNATDDNIVFDAESWKEMSRPDNYVWYNNKRKLRSEKEKSKRDNPQQSFRAEKMWVLIALLALFVPIFSIEFFFTLSRQVICGGSTLDQGEWAQLLCSPANINADN